MEVYWRAARALLAQSIFSPPDRLYLSDHQPLLTELRLMGSSRSSRSGVARANAFEGRQGCKRTKQLVRVCAYVH